MKIVAYANARAVCLFPIEEFAPLAGTSERTMLMHIAARYKFTRTPDLGMSREELEKKGLVFDHGELMGMAEQPIQIHQMSIYRDGVVVSAPTTDAATIVFNDAHDWLVAEFGFRAVAPTRLYLSEVVVDFERPLSKLFKDFAKVQELAMRHVVEDSREAENVAIESLDFKYWLRGSGTDIPRFIIDRRAGAGPEQERYFCSAPLQTKHHVEVLADIEKLLS